MHKSAIGGWDKASSRLTLKCLAAFCRRRRVLLPRLLQNTVFRKVVPRSGQGVLQSAKARFKKWTYCGTIRTPACIKHVFPQKKQAGRGLVLVNTLAVSTFVHNRKNPQTLLRVCDFTSLMYILFLKPPRARGKNKFCQKMPCSKMRFCCFIALGCIVFWGKTASFSWI